MYALAVEIQTVIGKEKLAFIGRQRASTVNSDIAYLSNYEFVYGIQYVKK
jgi:hypothetical protein